MTSHDVRQGPPSVGLQPCEPGRPLRISAEVWDQIRESIAHSPAERGGVLGGSREDGVVRVFEFDDTSACTRATYSPDHVRLNRLFREDWNPRGLSLLGFVHSHPMSFTKPSAGDLSYAKRILEHNPELDRLLLPIVMTVPDTGEFRLLPYAAVRDGEDCHIELLQLEIVSEAVKDKPSPQKPAAGDAFVRVKGAYDLDRLRDCRVICVGTGGAASFIEDLVRSGVGQLVLIDPDVVSAANLATQQVYRGDIGRAKVRAIARRLRAINPDTVVVTRQMRLDDLDDLAFMRLALDPIKGRAPAVTLLCGLTDNFGAQARVNRLALRFGLPSLCAQVYREGRGAEVTFTFPGVTPACHRCILSSRYQAHLEDGFRNDVTSDGTPIWSTTRLNALKGVIAMALLHHGTNHPRWGGLLARIGHRNLVQIRADPDIANTLGLDVFDRVFGPGDRERILFDEAVWLPQKPDCPETGTRWCPDCGGTGDLREARRRFTDTREMPR